MALIAMCAYCTPENGKLKYLKQTLESISKTVDLKKHRIIIIDNNRTQESFNVLGGFALDHKNVEVLNPGENIGTAAGINLALRRRQSGEVCIKMDDDWTTDTVGWVELMQAQIEANPPIGILGLRRDDVYGELIPDGELLWNNDVMGTCTMYNPELVERIGGLVQFSAYGYDDSVYSIRSIAAGFKNAYMRNIKITNLDEGGTEYTEWKKREAGLYAGEAGWLMDKIRKGELSYYYPFE